MSFLLIPHAYPAVVPTDEPVSRLRPVRSETVAGLADTIAALRNHQIKVAFTKFFEHDADPTQTHEGDITWQDPGAVSYTYRVDWTASPEAEFVVLFVVYHRNFSKGGASQIDVALQDVASSDWLDEPGAAGAPGITWPKERMAQRRSLAAQDVSSGLYEYPLQSLTTGTVIDDDPAAYPGVPRPLIIPGAYVNGELQVLLDCTNCRIVSVTLMEAIKRSAA